MLSTLSTSGNKPNLHILANEASSGLKQGLLNNKIKYQLVPLYLHRRNASERAIQTFRGNFITCLCTDNPKYSSKEWYCFLLQAILTLNMLRNYRFNPWLSAHVALHGIFDYNKTPIAPLGTRVLVREKTTNCVTWVPGGTNVWYIGPALEKYWCVECYIPSTHSTRISDTVGFIYTVITIPKTSSEEYLRQ